MWVMLLGLVLIGIVVLSVPLGCILSDYFKPNPQRPEITYGEFPFRLEYEINGERVVVEDTVICKFDGFGVLGWGDGKHRKWKSWLASDKNMDFVLLKTIDDSSKLFYTLGSAAYYMGDGPAHMYAPDYPTVHYHAVIEKPFNGGTLSSAVKADELLNKYGIRIINFEPSDPIVNTFI